MRCSFFKWLNFRIAKLKDNLFEEVNSTSVFLHLIFSRPVFILPLVFSLISGYQFLKNCCLEGIKFHVISRSTESDLRLDNFGKNFLFNAAVKYDSTVLIDYDHNLRSIETKVISNKRVNNLLSTKVIGEVNYSIAV